MTCQQNKFKHSVTWEREQKRGAGVTFSEAPGLGANLGALFI